ncbi:MAG: hypothetical protein ACE5HU_04525 [Acidobacteriota bacterium]
MATTPQGCSPSEHSRTLRTAAHELGNLASRLVFLSASLKSGIRDPAQRQEASEMLEDTHRKLQRMAASIRKIADDV